MKDNGLIGLTRRRRWLQLAFAVSLGGSASRAAESTASTAKPTTVSKPGAGVVNDWLRTRSADFSAWDVGGQFRLRYEDRENAGAFPNRDFIHNGQANSDDYLLLREKLHLGWTPTTWVKLYAEGRNSTVDRDKRVPSPESDKLDLHQAYVQVGDAKQFPLTLKLGRQEFLCGDERFIGIGDWSNTGRVFDAAKVRYETRQVWVDAFVGRVILPDDNNFNQPNDYDHFSGVYASTQTLVPWQETQFFALSRDVGAASPNAITTGQGGPGPRDIYTLGTRWKSLPGKLGGWDYAFEAAAQFGNIRSGTVRLEQEAYSATVSGGHTWKNAWGTPRLGVGHDFATGDADPNDNKSGTFDLLFGTNHRFYGMMDLFGLRNTHSPRLSASVKPLKNLTVSADYLGFWLADTHDFLYPESGAGRSANGYGRNPQFSSFVGSEIDVYASYAFRPWANFQVGYGHFFVGDYIRQSVNKVVANGGAVDADWIHVQTTFNF